MCGIVGAYGQLPDLQTFEAARDSMTHRGPDDVGVYYNETEQIAFGQRRLSIIDLSEAGRQPFVSNDGRYVITFNGEIYNYKEIKEELQGKYDFKTETDTEVLLAASIEWGVHCLQKLNGMFAFAVWDKEKQELFIARDRLGIKPLYYAVVNDTMYFASEMKAILASTDFPRKLNKQAFLDYLSYRYPLGEQTMFQNMFAFLPGHYSIVGKEKKVEQIQYWDLPVVTEKNDPGEEEVLEETERLIKQSLAFRMRSDVPVGAYLSGGLDSSVLVAMMSEMTDKPVMTYSISFDEDGFNESAHARVVADVFKTDHHEFLLHEKDYMDLLTEVIRFKDAPLSIPNEVAVHVLSKELKKDITVVLSGEGADELFGGYGRIFRSGYDFERLKDKSELSEEERKTFEENFVDKYGKLNVDSAMDHFLNQYTYFNYTEKEEILNTDVLEINTNTIARREYFATFFEKIKDLPVSAQYMYVFQLIHLLGPLYRLDTTTMSKSVEARVPFVDHTLIEYVSGLPLKYKMRYKSEEDKKKARVLNSDQISETHDTTKYALRKIAEKYLPKEILERKKVGFPVPLNRWFCGGTFTSYAKDILLSPDARSAPLYNKEVLETWLDCDDAYDKKRRGYNIWMLLNMELWMREYNVVI